MVSETTTRRQALTWFFEAPYPELARYKTLLGYVVGDLKPWNLSDIPLNTMMTAAGVFDRRTLPLGAELLDLIATLEQ